MESTKGLAFCGLACCVCGENGDCAGCRNAGSCRMAACCRERGIPGCWECSRFPCEEPMLQKPRVRAFCRFAARYGETALLERLARDKAAGIRYHHPGLLTGDYDALGGEADILAFLETVCEIHPLGSLSNLRYVVTLSEQDGQLLLSRHSARATWETQGGHIEPGETPEEAAHRELWEECGAAECTLIPLCDYRAGHGAGCANGRVYVALLHGPASLPESEMAETKSFPTLPAPAQLTYPAITPFLWAEAQRQGHFRPALLRGFWQDVLAQDAGALPRYFAPGAQVLWPNTRERFTAGNYIRANCAYPGHWQGAAEQLHPLADGRWLTVALVQGEGISLHALSLFTFDPQGRIAQLEEYWSDDGAPPVWRQRLKAAEPVY